MVSVINVIVRLFSLIITNRKIPDNKLNYRFHLHIGKLQRSRSCFKYSSSCSMGVSKSSWEFQILRLHLKFHSDFETPKNTLTRIWNIASNTRKNVPSGIPNITKLVKKTRRSRRAWILDGTLFQVFNTASHHLIIKATRSRLCASMSF